MVSAETGRRAIFVDGSDDARDDIVDKSVIARTGSIAKLGNGNALSNAFGESEDSHVGATTRAIYSEKSQSNDRKVMEMRIVPRQQLAAALGRSIRRFGMIERIVRFNKRNAVTARAIHRAGRGKYKVSNLRVFSHLFQQYQSASDI